LAKVDVEENPTLALRYNIRSIPNIKAFRDGQLVSEFLGLQPETRVREFIRNLAPSQIDLLLEKGQSQLESMSWGDAGTSFRQFLTKSPNHPRGYLGLLKSYLMQGAYSEAKHLIDDFPPSPEYTRMELLKPLYEALVTENDTIEISDELLSATYQNALRLVKRGNLAAAMDGLIDILRQDKRFRNDVVRKVLVGIFELLGDNHPLTISYRRELAMVLF
jgi:putative thioredoxin